MDSLQISNQFCLFFFFFVLQHIACVKYVIYLAFFFINISSSSACFVFSFAIARPMDEEKRGIRRWSVKSPSYMNCYFVIIKHNKFILFHCFSFICLLNCWFVCLWKSCLFSFFILLFLHVFFVVLGRKFLIIDSFCRLNKIVCVYIVKC